MDARWLELRLGEYLERLGSSAPAPGGGSAACLAGALSAALGHMVIAVAREKEPSPERTALAEAFAGLQARFAALAADDEAAFDAVMAALRAPREEPGRAERVQTALERAADVPLAAAAAAVVTLEHLRSAEAHASRAIVSDVGAAAHLALAAARSSLLNVAVNVRSLRAPAAVARLELAANAARDAAHTLHADVAARVEARLAAPRS